MKPIALLTASALALCLCHTAAGAMNSVPYSGRYPGPTLAPQLNGTVRNPVAPDGVNSPYADPRSFSPYRAGRPNGQRSPRSAEGFLNIDPFDPNSVMNSYDRDRYANPYPFNPIYNPYGQGGSAYAPTAPYIVPGQGIPYRP